MARRRRLERLNRREEKMAVKKTVYLSIVSIFILIFIFTLGVPLLGKFADFLDVVFRNKVEQASNEGGVQAPILDPLPQATNSAGLSITGFSATSGKVLIYNNDEKIDETETDGGEFLFGDFTLREGENNIAVKAISAQGKESDFSAVAKVLFLQKEPSLSVSEPSEGQNFSGNNRIKVAGKTDRDVQVYANGFLANTTIEGSFEVFVPLSSGENTIEVKAVDLSGNTKIAKVKVNFSN